MRTHPHRTGPATRLALVVAIGLSTAGCALVRPPEAAETGGTATPAVLAWTDTVCSALVPVVQSLGAPPQLDLATPAATRDAFVAYLAQAQAVADRALRTVTAAGAAPVDGGEQVARDVQRDVAEFRDELADARHQVEHVDVVADPTAVLRSVAATGNVVGAVGTGAQALRSLGSDPRVHAAYAQAQTCAQLRALPLPGR